MHIFNIHLEEKWKFLVFVLMNFLQHLSRYLYAMSYKEYTTEETQVLIINHMKKQTFGIIQGWVIGMFFSIMTKLYQKRYIQKQYELKQLQ